MATADDAKFEFTKLLEGIDGAEGPVFDNKGNFYMVGPFNKKDVEQAGQIFQVNLTTNEVCNPSLSAGYLFRPMIHYLKAIQ